MKALLYKQFRLVAHPASYIFCLFGIMLMIPSYPYTVAFFYVTLGLFFTFQNAREQRDSDFSALLPVNKADTVRASVLYCVIMELFSIVFAVPFLLWSSKIRPMGGNAAGIDANVAMLGMAFIVFALFNIVFLPSFYKSGYKVGASFLKASVAVFLLVAVDIVAPHVFGFLDGYNPAQWYVLAAGAAVYAVCTVVASKVSQRRYERVDL